ncbi:MFS transporter [Falsiroseomonas selenitidurans]|uniref:MFS transporter n=1 Tax=Falsiroseomonas selenitidurans TaxID=2716335 RepID=A0ABX1E4Y6_9PROT|nr:MFS transporter [Falsiroseomonas selenitidurans]NKC32252.1 MFS transporter [Falsiroseomonas selenitidurans]
MVAPASPDAPPSPGHDARILALIGTGHFLSHFYMLCLPPLFLVWRDEFDVSFGELGLAVALMSAVTAALQTPVGFLVDRHGARPFLVGGVLLMALSIAAMAFAPGYWAILLLALLSGVGNSVIHPADYAILGGSIHPSRIGRAFAMHTFTGNLGFAAGPPVVAAMLLVMGWRPALLVLGLIGIPVVLAILWQSRILQDQAKPKPRHGTGPVLSGRELLLSRPILLFFGFFLLSAMAGSVIQAFSITVLIELWGTPVAIASFALTGYMAGATGGTLVGGWFADRSRKHLAFIVGLTLVAALLLLALGLLPLPHWLQPVVAGAAGLAMGSSRTPRDVMLKDAIPPGQMGKVFGFVSSGLPLGGAITPVPVGLLLDFGLAWMVLPLAALLLLASLLCMGRASSAARRAAPLAVPAE